MQRVLVVGENAEESKALAFRLGFIGFEATASVKEVPLALQQLFAFKPNAIVLDCCPGDGWRDLFCLLETVCQLPIVVLGSGDSEDEVVWYLEQGAADYVLKPVSPSHLSARLKAVLRHSLQEQPRGVLRVGDLEIDLDGHEVRRNGRIIPLTPTEFRLLCVLAERPGQACTHRMLLERIWGEDFADCAHYLRLYVGYLRQKLEDDPKRPRLLVTQWGVGYRLLEGRPRRSLLRLRPVRTATA